MKPHVRALALMLGGIAAVACQDMTSPLPPVIAQPEAPLPSLTVKGSTMTLVGTELVLENGKRIPVDSATARNFRSLAVSMPKTQELAKRMALAWAKLGLPEPTSELEARLALAAFKERTAAAVHFDVVPLTNAPVRTKPTLIAECDPVFTFCGFDTGTDPNAGGGGMGGGGGGSTGGSANTPFCINMFTQLYIATAQWRTWLNMLDQFRVELGRCADVHPTDWPVACSLEVGHIAIPFSQLIFWEATMNSYAQSLRAFQCI